MLCAWYKIFGDVDAFHKVWEDSFEFLATIYPEDSLHRFVNWHSTLDTISTLDILAQVDTVLKKR